MNEDIKDMINFQIDKIESDMIAFENEEEYKTIKEQLDLLLRIKANTRTLCSMIKKTIDKI